MCKHNWAKLVAQKGKNFFLVSNLKVCLKCGQLRVGKKTIRISKDRIDMGGKPIREVGKLLIRTDGRLKIPVGTDRFD